MALASTMRQICGGCTLSTNAHIHCSASAPRCAAMPTRPCHGHDTTVNNTPRPTGTMPRIPQSSTTLARPLPATAALPPPPADVRGTRTVATNSPCRTAPCLGACPSPPAPTLPHGARAARSPSLHKRRLSLAATKPARSPSRGLHAPRHSRYVGSDPTCSTIEFDSSHLCSSGWTVRRSQQFVHTMMGVEYSNFHVENCWHLDSCRKHPSTLA